MVVLLPERFLHLGTSGVDIDDVKALVCQVLHNNVTPSQLSVEALKGGITNQLLLVHVTSENTTSESGKKLLVRAFGRGTNTFINRDREFASHQQLMRLGLASELFSRFGNGLVYAYEPGRPTKPDDLSLPEVMVGVANMLGRWHAQLKVHDLAAAVPSQEPGHLWTLLDKWISMLKPGILSCSLESLRDEFVWLRSTIGDRGGDQVVGHCDLLSGNILVRNDFTPSKNATCEVKEPFEPSDLVFFIDYEYTLPCPRAFDIANHLWEWQGFECDRSKVLDVLNPNWVLRCWVQQYLASYVYFKGAPSNEEKVLNELKVYWGMPGFYWGIWSAIQSVSSDIDFDYAGYARLRMQEYYDWKKTVWPVVQSNPLL